MGFTDLFGDQQREHKRLYKEFSLEFNRLRTMVEEIEANQKFVRENGHSDELPSTQDVAKARENFLENSAYLLMSKGDLKDQAKKVQKLPDQIMTRFDEGHPDQLGKLRDFDDDSFNRYKEMDKYIHLHAYMKELETVSQSDDGPQKSTSSYSKDLAREHARLGVQIPKYKARNFLGAGAHCLTQAACIPLQKEIDTLQTILEDDIGHLRAMLSSVSEAIASIIGVREEYSSLRQGLDEDLDYREDIDDIDQEDEKRSLLLNSIYGIKS